MAQNKRCNFPVATLLITLLTCCILPSHGESSGQREPADWKAVSREYRPNRFSKRAELHYGLSWGIDSLSVKWTESGEVVRFSYRVVDPQKASTLNDEKLEPGLIDPAARVSLTIPALEKVGKLRQVSSPIAGRSYWMAFSNKGRLVRRGDRVTVVIGTFRAEGLVVD